MPVTIAQYIKVSPTAVVLPPTPAPEPIPPPPDGVDPRFTGYQFYRDRDGNIIKLYPTIHPQPASWSARETRTVNFDLR